MLPTITIDGRLVADPELRFTQQGKAACSFRVAASDSKKDDAGNWQTTEQVFISVTLWDTEGEAAADQISKGDRVLVTGRLYQREYETRDGEKRIAYEIKYPTVGKVVTAARAQRDRAATTATADPWATPSSPAEPPF